MFRIRSVMRVVRGVGMKVMDKRELLRRVEVEEGVVFIAHPDSVGLALGLYLNDPNVLRLFDVDGSGSLKDKMVRVLEKLIEGYQVFEYKDLKDSNPDRVTVNEIFKALNFLKNSVYLGGLCASGLVVRVLKSPEAVLAAGKHCYLRVLGYLLSSFNLATNLVYDGRRLTETDFMRITLPGQMFLDAYASFALGSIHESELKAYLRGVISAPKLMLDYARKTINDVVELPILALARSVAEDMSFTLNSDHINLYMYLTEIANDITTLLMLYEEDRVDVDMLVERGLVRWKPHPPL